jgi:3-phytase
MAVRREVVAVVALVMALMAAVVGVRALASDDPRSAAGRTDRAGGPVTASVETEPMPEDGDSADDPAIWVHPEKRALSTVIGTDKLGGLAVYGLGGRRLHYYADGEINNVDLRYGFPLAGRRVTLVVASNYDSSNSIRVYRVNPRNRGLVYVAARTLSVGGDIYGICMYRSPVNGRYYAFATMKDGEVEQWRLFGTPAGKVGARRVRSFDVGSVTEGCVADDRLRRFYVAEEDKGIWRYGAEPGAGASRVRVDRTGSGGHLTADAEGLTIYRAEGKRGYLLASSQGSSDYTVYRRGGENHYVGRFSIAAGRVDGTDTTDGIDVVSARLGPTFKQGLFVAQDNTNPGGNQNFKLVPWQRIAHHFGPDLVVDSTTDPAE